MDIEQVERPLAEQTIPSLPPGNPIPSPVQTPSSPPDRLSTSNRTAAERVYALLELRRRIITYLPIKDHSRFLLVEKGCMEHVARSLYYSMGYAQLQSNSGRLSESDKRDILYRNALSEINACDLVLSDDMRQALSLGADTTSDHLKSFHVDFLDYFAPLLRQEYIGLRKVLFGSLTYTTGNGVSYWEVTFHPLRTSGIVDGPGHIRHFQTLKLKPSDPPFSFAIPSPFIGTTGKWTIVDRFDMDLHFTPYSLPTAEQSEARATALRSNQAFGNIHRRIQLVDMSASLDDMTALYEHQIALGFLPADRVKSFRIRCTHPPTLSQFTTFSNIASTSITRLKIAGAYPATGAKISFTQLGDLLSAIRKMPNLFELHMAIADIELAADTASTMLDSSTLQKRGSIKDLGFYTSPNSLPHFQLLRALAPFLSKSAKTKVFITHSDPKWDTAQLSACLVYMRSQIHSRKLCLSTIDFSTLDIHTTETLIQLDYDDDGTPQRRNQTKATFWAAQTGQVRATIPSADRSTQDLEMAAIGLQEISANGTDQEMMKRSLRLLDATLEAEKRMEEMSAIVKTMKGDVTAYIDVLAARMG